MHHSKPHHHFSTLFWLHLLFFMHIMIYFELKWPWIEKHCKWTLEWNHNFTHIASAKKLRGLQEKLDALCVQTGQSPSKYQGFGWKLVYYKGISFFTDILTQDFFCIQYAPFKATSSLFNPILTSFAIFHAFPDLFWAKWPWNWKALQITIRKDWKLAWYHHFTHIACAKKLRGLRQKVDPLRVQNGQSLLKYQGFRRKLVCYKLLALTESL